jgi:hypothetical protein
VCTVVRIEACETVDMVLGMRGRSLEGDGPLWPVTESVGVCETWEPISPWSPVADALLVVESLLRLVSALLGSGCLIGEILASREKDGLNVGFLLVGALLIWASSSSSLLLRRPRLLNRSMMLVNRDMLALCYL